MRAVPAILRFRTTRVVRNRSVSGNGDRGASPVELAVVLPAIFVLIFVSLQAAIWYMARSTALNAAQEAVNAQRTFEAGDGVGETRAQVFLDRAGDWLLDAEVEVTPVGAGDTEVSATVTGQAIRVVPLIPLPPISETAHGTVERWTDVVP
ncbi:TadE-like protein [Micromonospora pisi]|uniref:TadE-like protein n=1 Tax=Micromonospora pisi TaxID=589240 RepID=A0A495JIV5_9ACTN|nr:TadE family protein [Micromonospora pisi]RKR89000.1 TadE-like protein [Micromonospora pisi]